MDHSTIGPHLQPRTRLYVPIPATSDTPIGHKALPKESDPEPLTSLLLSHPPEIHLMIFEHLDSIHTLILLTQTCKQLRTSWLHSALSICTNRAKNHGDKGCQLAILQQRDADARVPGWGETAQEGGRKDEEKRERVNREIAVRVMRNKAIVNRAGEKLISQLRCERISNVDLWTGMPSHQGAAQYAAVKEFRVDAAKMGLNVDERERFEDAYYRYWIQNRRGLGAEGKGGMVMRHGELDLRSLFLRKVLLREGGRVKGRGW
ncbi:MAG: hypothetical protein Q9169_000973 [Polycauliona sp. 2 TL-2023]